MFYAAVFLMGILGHLASGVPLDTGAPLDTAVPLEDSSADFSQFFDSRIVGGTEAAEGSSPYMVALLAGINWFVCGASIISKKHCLTAAHCMLLQGDGELLREFRGSVGSNTWRGGTIIEFEGHCNHHEYDAVTINNDIGVLFTKNEIQLSERVAIIALNCDWIGAGVKSFVTGWGTERLWGPTPDALQFLKVVTIGAQECEKSMSEAVGVGRHPPIHHDLEICTFHSPGHGMCHGDSGSALVLYEEFEQVGIVSWGAPCARGAPDIFARISAHCDFIIRVTTHGCHGPGHNRKIPFMSSHRME